MLNHSNFYSVTAPEEVLPPRALAHADSLSVYWDPPRKPNGIITHYTLYKDDTAIYKGNDTAFNITGKDEQKNV